MITASASASDAARSAAQALIEARCTGGRLTRLALEVRPRDHRQAADIIRETLRRLDAEICGWKIGHSANGPTFGPILTSLLVPDGGVAGAAPCGVTGFEGEIAIRLGRDPSAETDFEIDTCIDTVHPAIELIAPRFQDFRGISALEAEADLGINGGAVIGAGRPFRGSNDLGSSRVSAMIDHTQIFEAPEARERMEPLPALRWLSGILVDVDLPLRAGHYVLLGARTGLVETTPPHTIAVTMGEFGTVSCRLAAPDDCA